jgi:hypothetical protein
MPLLSRKRIISAFRAGDLAATHHDRGRALEDLITYIICRIPGVHFMQRDVRVAAGSEEIDLVFWNDRSPNGLPYLPNILVFECKNWTVPVDSASVDFFANKVRTRRLECGFLIAANGITGDQVNATAAYQRIDMAFIQDNVRLLVIDRAEIEALRSTSDFSQLLKQKIAQIVLRAR